MRFFVVPLAAGILRMTSENRAKGKTPLSCCKIRLGLQMSNGRRKSWFSTTILLILLMNIDTLQIEITFWAWRHEI